MPACHINLVLRSEHERIREAHASALRAWIESESCDGLAYALTDAVVARGVGRRFGASHVALRLNRKFDRDLAREGRVAFKRSFVASGDRFQALLDHLDHKAGIEIATTADVAARAEVGFALDRALYDRLALAFSGSRVCATGLGEATQSFLATAVRAAGLRTERATRGGRNADT